MPSRAGLWLRSLGLAALGAVILVALVQLAGADDVRRTLAAGDARLLGLAFLLLTSQTLTMGFRWWLALRLLGFPVRLVDLIRANCLSNFINFFAPGHFGEPAVAAWLGRTGRAPPVEAFTVLVAIKALATVLNGVILLASLTLVIGSVDGDDLAVLGGLVAVILLAAVALLFVVLHPAALRVGVAVAAAGAERFGAALGRPEWGDRARPLLERLAERVRDTFDLCRRRPAALVAATGVSLIKVGTLLGMMALIFAAYGQPVGLVGALFLETADALGNIVSIWIPANLGVQEGILSAAASAGLQTDGPVALSAAIASKVLLTAHVALGGLVFVGLGPVSSRLPAPSEATSGAASSAP